MYRSPRNQKLVGNSTCPSCGGQTTIFTTKGGVEERIDCEHCYGLGIIDVANACSVCRGTGRVSEDIGYVDVLVSCVGCNGAGLVEPG